MHPLQLFLMPGAWYTCNYQSCDNVDIATMTTATELPTASTTERHRLTVQGVVQGVGFRPFVYGLAVRFALRGFVGNDSAGVFIEIEGPPDALARFRACLTADAPPLAHIDAVTVEPVSLRGDSGFTIVPSRIETTQTTLISPDLTVCDACLRELFNPNDRRYRYPFINCTNCGPRFTIIRAVPYDRPFTTMAAFDMCPRCQAEYDDPRNRRFHAQPNACPVCGPQLEFRGGSAADPLLAAQAVLRQGGIVAVKGLGGFHLACDATNDAAVQRLRQRKGRIDKPFALMVADVTVAQQLTHLSPAEETRLTSRERPIVLLHRRENPGLPASVAPGNPNLGVMLPYTPLHYLLFDGGLDALVMTSGNLSNEPIAIDNDDALTRLSALADAFLLHNRDIYVPCDDSVVRVFDNTELPIRRSRGYAPFPVRLPVAVPPTLAVGGELKNTFCLAQGPHAFMSQHIGDMETLETLQVFDKAAQHFKDIFRVAPQAIACDLHPGYLSSRWAKDTGLDVITVQHHHAHIAAVMAEHGCSQADTVIGFSFDGTGYGTDGTIWGGEVLLAQYARFERAAHLKPVPLPGGDVAVKRPYRMALAYLWAAAIEWEPSLPAVAACAEIEQGIIRRQLETGLNTTHTSSMGRLFDAVSALIGVCQTVTYEGQAAILLEAIADPHETGEYPLDLVGSEPIVIDTAPLIRAIVAAVRAGVPAAVIAGRFHNTLAGLMVQLSRHLRQETGLRTVALSGGVFQNVTLLGRALERLQAENFHVLTHQRVPPNDGGLALGQAVIAGSKTKGV